MLGDLLPRQNVGGLLLTMLAIQIPTVPGKYVALKAQFNCTHKLYSFTIC
jgi:hypothetical protein